VRRDSRATIWATRVGWRGAVRLGAGRFGLRQPLILQRHLRRVRVIGRVLLSLGGRVEDRFDVEVRGVVDRFEAADEESQAVDIDDLDSVEANRVGPAG
jgi:hypothetical protein